MNDDQKDITEEQRLQQAQSSGQSSTAPAGGQAGFSADYSAAQQVQDGVVAETTSEDVPTEQGGLVGDSNEAVSNNSAEIPAELSEEDDSVAVMNDSTEDNFEEGVETGDEEVEDTEEPVDGESEEVVEEETSTEEEPTQSLPGSVVGPDGQTGVVADSPIVGPDQQGASSDASTDAETGDIPAPDLTPETDAASVDAAIDGAFADYNGGDSDTGGVLGGGADD